MKLGHKRIILDYHFSSFLPQTLTKVDPADYVRRMKAAGIESFLVYAKDHWGNVYHKTKISPTHPNAPADLFGTLLRLCRENGITPYAYTTILWDEHSARKHPEWRYKDARGQLLTGADAGWNFLCINTGYRQFFLQQIDELAAGYEFPSLFLDILGYNPTNFVCYCDSCRALWQEKYDREMPAEMGLADKLRYTAFRDAFYTTLYQDVRAVLSRHGKADCLVTHNTGGTAPQLPSYIAKETEPFGNDYIAPQIICKETRNRAKGRDCEIFFGRFNRFWDFTVKSKALLRWEVVNAFAHGCATTIIDQPLLDGRADPKAYEAIGFAYDHGSRLLPFVEDSKPYAEIGVYYDHVNYEVTGATGHEDFVGACKVLTELHWPFDVVTDFDEAASWSRYAAIVVPHTPVISQRVQRMLRVYLEAGGTIISDFAAGQWDESGQQARSRHFLIETDRTWPVSANFIWPLIPPEETYLRVGPMLKVSVQPSDMVLGYVQPGALQRNQVVWVSHNIPPGEQTTEPAALVRQVGKGRLMYFNSAIFADYLQTNLLSLREFIRAAMSRVYSPRLWVNAPSIVDAIFQEKDGQYVITLNCCTLDRGSSSCSMSYGTKPPLYMNINETFSIGGIEICSSQPIFNVTTLDGSGYEVIEEGGIFRLRLSPVDGYQSIRLKLGNP